MTRHSSIFIRKSIHEDIPNLLSIFDSARKYMRANNNLRQWSENYPGEPDILNDIEKGNSYLGIDSDGDVVMTFAFIKGEDPTYKRIKGGKWLNDKPYGTIHRIASNGKISGVLRKACDFCFNETENLRIDTHEDNGPMLNALDQIGFLRCGIINCRDGSPRLAFQLTKNLYLRNS